jgi:hypothetical protein
MPEWFNHGLLWKVDARTILRAYWCPYKWVISMGLSAKRPNGPSPQTAWIRLGRLILAVWRYR